MNQSPEQLSLPHTGDVSFIQAPGGTLYLRCAVCQVRLGELYLDDGRVALCLSCPIPKRAA